LWNNIYGDFSFGQRFAKRINDVQTARHRPGMKGLNIGNLNA
jgi:hypothetical protein